MENLVITVLLGTAREERESEKIAKWITQELNKKEAVTAEIFDVRNLGYIATTPPWGVGGANEKSTDWKKAMASSDGLVIVVPEYNRGYPGELKLTLDSLYDEYTNKPALVCGVSGGTFRGARVVEHIQPVLNELKMIFIKPPIHISRVADDFTEDGPRDSKFSDRVEKSFKPFLAYAEIMKENRERF